ncbi:MAG: hypothetical protein WCL29_06110, partial [Pseudomonadota bacterium]
MKIIRDGALLIALAALGGLDGPVVLAQSPRVVPRTMPNLPTSTTLRDPTQPPAAYAAPVNSARMPAGVIKPDHLVTVNGVRYLVWNSRRYAIGEMIDGARIERITESDVWLRGADGVRKLTLFSGIEKRPPDSGTPTNSSMRTSMDGNKKGP